MRHFKLLLPLALLITFPWMARPQGVPLVPKFALFGGYTLIQSTYDAASGLGTATFHQVGWEVSAEGKVFPWVGMVADASQQNGFLNKTEKQSTLLVGPQFSPHVIPHVIPFAHWLFGAVNGTIAQTSAGAVSTGTVFATAVGGGVDIKIFGPLWLRPVQVDYIHANLAPDHHTNFRVSAGFVLRL